MAKAAEERRLLIAPPEVALHQLSMRLLTMSESPSAATSDSVTQHHASPASLPLSRRSELQRHGSDGSDAGAGSDEEERAAEMVPIAFSDDDESSDDDDGADCSVRGLGRMASLLHLETYTSSTDEGDDGGDSIPSASASPTITGTRHKH